MGSPMHFNCSCSAPDTRTAPHAFELQDGAGLKDAHRPLRIRVVHQRGDLGVGVHAMKTRGELSLGRYDLGLYKPTGAIDRDHPGVVLEAGHHLDQLFQQHRSLHAIRSGHGVEL